MELLHTWVASVQSESSSQAPFRATVGPHTPDTQVRVQSLFAVQAASVTVTCAAAVKLLELLPDSVPELIISVPVRELGAVMVNVSVEPGLLMVTGLLVTVTPADAPDRTIGTRT